MTTLYICFSGKVGTWLMKRDEASKFLADLHDFNRYPNITGATYSCVDPTTQAEREVVFSFSRIDYVLHGGEE